MQAYRTYKNNEYSNWVFPSAGTLAEKIVIQRAVKNTMAALREPKLNWYAIEGATGKEYKELYAKYFTVHKRRGYEIHELNCNAIKFNEGK